MIAATDVRDRLRYVIHLGLVDIRNLAFAGGHDQQIADLADILEILPAAMGNDSEPDLTVIHEEFERYELEYPEHRYKFLDILDGKQDVHSY